MAISFSIPTPRFYQAIIFDLNGTLIEIFKESEYYAHLNEMAKVLGIAYDVFMKIWFKIRELNYPFGDYGSVRTRIIDSLLLLYDSKPINQSEQQILDACDIRYRYVERQQAKIKPGVLEILEWAISQNYAIDIISNCSMETPYVWPLNPMAKFIPNPTFSSELKINKPDPAIFHHSLQKLGIKDSTRCIYVADGDDHEFDTARALGMYPILITYDLKDAFRHEPFPENEDKLDNFWLFPQKILEIEKKKAHV